MEHHDSTGQTHQYRGIDAGDLIATIPHTLGFHPERSLVVIGLAPGTHHLIDVTARADLSIPADRPAVIARLLAVLAQQPITEVALIVIDSDGSPGTLPHRDLIVECSQQFRRAGVAVVQQLWAPTTTGPGHWHCYEHGDCGGEIPDPRFTAVAVAAVRAGLVTFPTREDLAATLAPEPDDVLARRADLIASQPDADDDETSQDRLRLVEAAVDQAMAGMLPKSDHEFVRLACALSDYTVRDTLLDLPDTERRLAAERLWTCLLRGTPCPERAEPAVMLAFSAYVRGDGVVAALALDHARAANRDHLLTQLLGRALLLGIRHDRMRRVAQEAAEHARQRLPEH